MRPRLFVTIMASFDEDEDEDEDENDNAPRHFPENVLIGALHDSIKPVDENAARD